MARISTSDVMGKRGKIEFYEYCLKKGVIKEGGAAHKRLLFLKGETEENRLDRLNEFLEKQRKRKEKVE